MSTAVEYAMEAISHAGTVLGILAKDGVVLAAEKRVTGKLLDLSHAKRGGGYGGSGEKMFMLNRYVCVSTVSWWGPYRISTVGKQRDRWRGGDRSRC